MTLFLEQLLNGLQLGITLFLVAAGLTLVFGIMGVINLAHGSLYMVGAFIAATVINQTGSFLTGVLVAIVTAGLVGMIVELLVVRRLYRRDHLDQVLATFGLILFFNQFHIMVFGRQPLFVQVPSWLSGSVEIIPGVPYPVYRLLIIAVGLLVAAAMFVLITKTRMGMLIRAGATHREMVGALGVDIRLLYTLVFGVGALLAGLSGIMIAPLGAVEVGMGEGMLILAFVTIVIGGIGSIRGAFIGAVLVGLVDTMGRAFIPDLLQGILPPAQAGGIGAGLSSMLIYILMAGILLWRPKGLFPSHG